MFHNNCSSKLGLECMKLGNKDILKKTFKQTQTVLFAPDGSSEDGHWHKPRKLAAKEKAGKKESSISMHIHRQHFDQILC